MDKLNSRQEKLCVLQRLMKYYIMRVSGRRKFFPWATENPTIIILLLASMAVLIIGWSNLFHWVIGNLASVIAMCALFFSVNVYVKQSRQDESKFYLEAYITCLEMILPHLKSDMPTRRMAWVTAASISNKLTIIEKKIHSKECANILEIHLRNYQHSILLFFSEIEYGKYFYGVDNAANLDEAAAKSKSCEIKTKDDLIPDLRVSSIEELQIANILRLIDPILEKEDGCSIFYNGKISLNVLKFNRHIFKGLYEYLDHRQKVVLSKLSPRT